MVTTPTIFLGHLTDRPTLSMKKNQASASHRARSARLRMSFDQQRRDATGRSRRRAKTQSPNHPSSRTNTFV
jgi:hypothetical protein